mmetsp:Transcript_40553/g.133609  ORF Transcript_40553/g.133609 Transcript_40553/m.133609 type:complete len:146 (-) Transcript_40553:232-669(-)
MAFVRTGGPDMAKAPPSLERQLKQLKKIRSDNGRKGAKTAKSAAILKKSAALKKQGTHGAGMLTLGAKKPNAVAAVKGSLAAGKKKTHRDGPFTETQKEAMRKLKAKGLSSAEIAPKFKTKSGKVATRLQVTSATRNNLHYRGRG